MSLAHFLKAFPHISLATEQDNDDILTFYHQSPMSTKKSQIQYFRGQDFFAFLKERSPHFFVFLLKNDDKEIQGIGVLSFRPGFVDKELVTVGYLGDLRVKLNRKLIREYRQMYAALIKASPTMEETLFCKHFQTVLIDDNKESQNNLTSNKIPNLSYCRLQSYRMMNIWGRVKGIPFIQPQHKIREANQYDHELIVKFLADNTLKNAFHHDWSQELAHRLKNWNGFDYRNILLVFNNKNVLMAVTMIWNPIKTKQVVISEISMVIKFAHTFLNLIPFVSIKQLPKPRQAIDILYLNEFVFLLETSKSMKRSVFQAVVRFCFNYDFNLLAYADFASDNILKFTPHLLKESLPMALYTVHHHDQEKGVLYPITDTSTPPGFDMSLV